MLDICLPIFVFVDDFNSDMNIIIAYESGQDIATVEVSGALFEIINEISRTMGALNITS